MKHALRFGMLVGLLLIAVASAYAAPACPAQPSNADGTTIASPAPDQTVSGSFTVKGQYFGSFEGVVPIQVLDANGTVLLKENAKNECCVLSPYERALNVKVGAPTPACVVVYRESGADGSLTALAQVPITIAPAANLPGTGGANSYLPALLLAAVLALLGGGALLLRRGRAARG